MTMGDTEGSDAMQEITMDIWGTTYLKLQEDGVTKPITPAFLAYNSGTDTNISNDAASPTTVEFNTEVFDIRSNYNNSTDTFTAPLTGKYLLGFHLRVQSLDSAAARYYSYIITSNRNYLVDIQSLNQMAGDLNYWTFSGTVLADMDANDTAYVRIHQDGGTAQADIYGTSSPQTRFYGYLLG